MDKAIEHNEQALQVEAARMQAEGATAYADAARASDAVGFEREDAERTLSLTVSARSADSPVSPASLPCRESLSRRYPW